MRRELLLAVVALGGCAESYAAEKNAVRAKLREPATAQFQGLQRCGQSQITKGQVNAANQYGGKTGFQDFYVENGVATVLGDRSLLSTGLDPNAATRDTSDEDIALIGRCAAAIRAETALIRKRTQ